MTVELNLKFRKVKKMTFRKDVNELLIKKHSRKRKGRKILIDFFKFETSLL
jgi:hypothetical protein